MRMGITAEERQAVLDEENIRWTGDGAWGVTDAEGVQQR